MSKFIIRAIIWISVVLLFAVRCASISPPTGGPRDSIPPRIVRAAPAPYTTNFKGDRITLDFNEFIQLKDQQKLFFVSPPGSRKPMLTIKNKSLIVQFEEPLDSATTYRLDFGNSIVDNNEGNAMQGFSFVFSTGNVIDSLMMAGQVIDAFTRDTIVDAFLFYFDQRADSAKLDSTLFNARADALFRSDSSGFFVADILKDKSYRLYALKDENGNQRYEAGEDRVAFTDTVYNPILLPGFSMVYDTTLRRMKIEDAQVVMEVFKEIPVRRQMMLAFERTGRQKLVLTFNSPDPIIDTLDLNGIDSTWLIKQPNLRGDSITIWIAPPTKEAIDALSDTITGRLVYQRNDSVWNYYSYDQKVNLRYKAPVAKKEVKPALTKAQKKAHREARKAEKRRKKQERKNLHRGIPQDAITDASTPATEVPQTLDPAITIPQELLPPETDTTTVPTDTLSATPELVLADDKNPFKFSVNARAELNPLENIVFTFDYPVLEIDTTNIELMRTIPVQLTGRELRRSQSQAPTEPTREQKKEVVPYTFSRIDGNPLRWRMSADWQIDNDYSLMIPSGAIRNIAWESNDTLSSNFKVASPEKYGTIVIQTQADSTLQASYIFELISGASGNGKIAKRITGVKAGESVSIYYVDAGTYRLRVIEDSNHNTMWDTGSLTERRPPEKVRIWKQGTPPDPIILAKENWELPLPIDLKQLFSQP